MSFFEKDDISPHVDSDNTGKNLGNIIDIYVENPDLGNSEVIVGSAVGGLANAHSPPTNGVFRKPEFSVFDSWEAASGNPEIASAEEKRQKERKKPNTSNLNQPSFPPYGLQSPFLGNAAPQFSPFGYALSENDIRARAEAWERRETQAAKRRYWRTPLILFLLTCMTTWFAGELEFGANGYLFSFAVMLILSCHEMGHYLQTRRYKMSSSLPYFIPMPFGPIGTMGAIIRMDDRIPNVKALFDIGISGPLAGLVPTVFFCWIGISLSHIGPRLYDPYGFEFGLPLLFEWFAYLKYGFLPENVKLYLHPFAFAGWVGLFITSLNLFPIGQLDGGHIFYALFKGKSKVYSSILFYVLIALVCYFHLWTWTLMLLLLAMMGHHPPTQNDEARIGLFRTVLGVLTLAFIFIGFTPVPIHTQFENENDFPTVFYAQLDEQNGTISQK